MDRITIGDRQLASIRIGPPAARRPTLVFLHEALGSIGLWRDFPAALCAATGLGGLVYERLGHGWSDPPFGPRDTDYLHIEALEILPAVLDAAGIADAILVGHSDGASIALIHAGRATMRPRAIVAMAPHVFVEPITLAGIRATVADWQSSGRADRFARHHRDADALFRAWHETWLDPRFRDWNMEDVLGEIACPVQLIQGVDDEYGSPAQLRAIAAQVGGAVETHLLPGCGHVPHRSHGDQVTALIGRFVGVLTGGAAIRSGSASRTGAV